MKLKKGDPIMVEWIDAVSRGGWGPAHNEGAEVTNVGIFVHRNKNGLCMARGWERGDQDDDQVLASAFIPAGMVKKIRKLR